MTWVKAAPPGAGRRPLKSPAIALQRPSPAGPLAMPLFWKHYKSDVTEFIEELKAKKPTLDEEQRAGRALLWDKRVDREALEEWRAANVPQQPYVYQTKS
ncbi:hypothetical protein BURC_00246 [Burkholderiaceae bacterium]|nr:hypothetical protein BURC_00246 [Burkholderiaceae bacterium]